jgi:hypothetical protein
LAARPCLDLFCCRSHGASFSEGSASMLLEKAQPRLPAPLPPSKPVTKRMVHYRSGKVDNTATGNMGSVNSSPHHSALSQTLLHLFPVPAHVIEGAAISTVSPPSRRKRSTQSPPQNALSPVHIVPLIANEGMNAAAKGIWGPRSFPPCSVWISLR